MKKNNLSKSIDNYLLRQTIITGEEITCDILMKKRDTIIKNHINNVYPIKNYIQGGTTYYYTKLDPLNRNHSRKISSTRIDEINDKIIAYYLDIETTNKSTVEDILLKAVEDLSTQTASRHKQLFNKHFSSIKDIYVSDLSECEIRSCLQDMIDLGIKAKAFNNAVSTLNKIYDYCAYNHIEIINIRAKVEEFRKYKLVGKTVFLRNYKPEATLAFSESEAVTLIKYALDNPDYINLAIAILLTTGLRAGELLALTIDDVDLPNSRLSVNKSECTKTREIIHHCKDDSERTVFLNSDARKIFEVLLNKRIDDCAVACEYLFLNSNSNDCKLHLRALDNRLRKVQHILGFTDRIAERSPHDCRRCYASIQFLKGVDIKTIQAQLGHANAQMTWEYIKDIIDSSTRSNRLEMGCIL